MLHSNMSQAPSSPSDGQSIQITYASAPCRGDSMGGTLAEGDRLWVSTLPFDSLHVGDVVVFRSGDLVLAHRIVARDEGGYRTQGDGNWGRDSAPLVAGRLIGKVVARERRGVRKPVSGGVRGRLRGAVLRAIFRVRLRVEFWLLEPLQRLVPLPRVAQSASCPEMDWLCKCIAPAGTVGTEPDPPEPLQLEGRPPCRPMEIHWPKILELATNHHVLPLVYRALKAGPSIPPEVLSQLHVAHLSIAAYNFRAQALLHRLQQLMDANGIQLIPIKGPALATLAYGDVALRQFEDLDLIVRREDLLRAVELLERDGWGLRELSRFVDRKRYLATLQNWSLEKPGHPPLDLKPVLVSHAFCGPSSADFTASACRRIPIDEQRSLWFPGPEAMLLAVCMDGANEMWVKLSSVADAGALLAKYPELDWDKFLGAAAGLGQRRSLLVGACLAEELLGCELPPAFRAGEKRDPAARRLAREAAERLRTLAPRHSAVFRQSLFAVRTRDRARDRIRFLRRLLFVPGAYEFGTRPGMPYALHAAMRPFRLAWDVFVRRGRHRRLTVRPANGKLPDQTQNA